MAMFGWLLLAIHPACILDLGMGRRKFVLGRVRKNAEKLKKQNKGPGRPKKIKKKVCIFVNNNNNNIKLTSLYSLHLSRTSLLL